MQKFHFKVYRRLLTIARMKTVPSNEGRHLNQGAAKSPTVTVTVGRLLVKILRR
jgi:hypothetical protein